MTHYDFELYLDAQDGRAALHADDLLDQVEQPLFEAFEGDVTPGMRGGVPVLYCSLDAESIESAIDRVAKTVIDLGLHPVQLLMRLGTDRYELA